VGKGEERRRRKGKGGEERGALGGEGMNDPTEFELATGLSVRLYLRVRPAK